MSFERLYTKRLPQNPLLHDPMLKYVLLLGLGIVLGWSMKNYSMQWLLMGCGLLLLVGGMVLYCFRGKNEKVWWLISSLAAMALIVVAAGWTQSVYNEVVVDNWPSESRVWGGNLVGVHKINDGYTTVDIKLHDKYREWNGKVVRVTFSKGSMLMGKRDSFMQRKKSTAVGKESARKEDVQSARLGDKLFFYCRLSSSLGKVCPSNFDYNSYLTVHHISGAGFVGGREKVSVVDSERLENSAGFWGWRKSFRIWMIECREKLWEEYAQYFIGEKLSILSALTLGDKTLLRKDTQEIFSDTGTSHILALSGLHLGILVSIFNFLFLRKMRRWGARVTGLVLIVGVLWLFTFLVGLPVSLVRASTMFTLMQIGVCMGRGRGATLNNLSVAALLLLIVDPLTLFDVGFQMSFIAVLSIILTERYIWQRFPLPLWNDGQSVFLKKVRRADGQKRSEYIRCVSIPLLKNECGKRLYYFFRDIIYPFICVSISAQWGTLPLVLYYFHIFATYAWLANFVVIPAAYVLLSFALLFFIFPLGIVRTGLAVGMTYVMDVMVNSLDWLSRLPGATMHVSASWVALVLIWLLPMMTYAFFQSRKRRLRAILMITITACLTFGVVAQMLYKMENRVTPHVMVYKVNGLPAVHFVQSSEKSYLLSSLSADSARQKLTYVNENYFVPNKMAFPQMLRTDETWSNSYLMQQKWLVMFRHKTIYLLNHALAFDRKSFAVSNAKCGMQIDLLVVARGCRNSYAEVCQVMQPRKVVLFSNLPIAQRKHWKESCEKVGIPCYDMAEKGYYEWKV